MSLGDKERFFSMAEAYDRLAQKLVPQYDFLQNEVLKMVPIEAHQKAIIIDLGAGSGIFLDRILANHMNVKCYWVDYSNDFLAVAKKRLSRYGEKVVYIRSSLEEKWEDVTDDASLVEKMGIPVKVIQGLEENIKITTLHDFALARFLEHDITNRHKGK